jgi:hypothetical protein
MKSQFHIKHQSNITNLNLDPTYIDIYLYEIPVYVCNEKEKLLTRISLIIRPCFVITQLQFSSIFILDNSVSEAEPFEGTCSNIIRRFEGGRKRNIDGMIGHTGEKGKGEG